MSYREVHAPCSQDDSNTSVLFSELTSVSEIAEKRTWPSSTGSPEPEQEEFPVR